MGISDIRIFHLEPSEREERGRASAGAMLRALLLMGHGVAGLRAASLGGLELFPPHRVSGATPVELWAAVDGELPAGAVEARLSVRGLHRQENFTYTLPAAGAPWGRTRVTALNLSSWPTGKLAITATLELATASSDSSSSTAGGASSARGQQLASREWAYEVVQTGVRSTRLLDGAFLDLVHWSAAEGKPYNEALRQMTAAQWRGQVADMAAAGIRTPTF